MFLEELQATNWLFFQFLLNTFPRLWHNVVCAEVNNPEDVPCMHNLRSLLLASGF